MSKNDGDGGWEEGSLEIEKRGVRGGGGGGGADLDVLAPEDYVSDILVDSEEGDRRRVPGRGSELAGSGHDDVGVGEGEVGPHGIEREPYPEPTDATGESLSEKLLLRNHSELVEGMIEARLQAMVAQKEPLLPQDPDAERRRRGAAAEATANPFLLGAQSDGIDTDTVGGGGSGSGTLQEENGEDGAESGGPRQHAGSSGSRSRELESEDFNTPDVAVSLADVRAWQRRFDRILRHERSSYLCGRLAAAAPPPAAYSVATDDTRLDAAALLATALLRGARAGLVENVT